jgi:hypothetical protein
LLCFCLKFQSVMRQVAYKYMYCNLTTFVTEKRNRLLDLQEYKYDFQNDYIRQTLRQLDHKEEHTIFLEYLLMWIVKRISLPGRLLSGHWSMFIEKELNVYLNLLSHFTTHALIGWKLCSLREQSTVWWCHLFFFYIVSHIIFVFLYLYSLSI